MGRERSAQSGVTLRSPEHCPNPCENGSSLQTRKSVSASDLAYAICEALKADGGFPQSPSVAVVPDDSLGWRALLRLHGPRSGRAQLLERFERLEQELRREYQLLDD